MFHILIKSFINGRTKACESEKRYNFLNSVIKPPIRLNFHYMFPTQISEKEIFQENNYLKKHFLILKTSQNCCCF